MNPLVFYLWVCVDFHIMVGIRTTDLVRELARWPIVLRGER